MQDSPERQRFRRKYLSLGVGEYTAALVFVTAAAFLVGNPLDNLALWSALLPLLVILLQAGTYWLLARRWVHRSAMPTRTARWYRVFRALDPLLLLAGLGGLITWFPTNLLGGAVIIAVWAFGLAEYLNYFVVRLSYPVTTWLAGRVGRRTPRLILDIRAAKQ